ncbi:MAG TPA: membrane protein insertase YidC [Flammeovirgaceae bacterium]|nr:membrane protein insertase YidC [Flammeovirgaceae bacterium]
MDRNQATGLILISILLLLYFSYFGNQPQVPQNDQPASTETPVDSTASVAPTTLATPDSLVAPNPVVDSLSVNTPAEELITVENENMKITFSNLGGVVKEVLLKDYLTYRKEPLILLDANSSRMSLIANNNGNKVDLYKLPYRHTISQDGDTTIVSFTLDLGNGSRFSQVYKLPPAGYLLDYKINAEGMNHLLNSDLILDWRNNLKSFEKDPVTSRIKTSVNYYTLSDGFEELGERSMDLETAEASNVKWLAFKQQFFTTSLIARNKFNKLYATQEVKEEFPEVDKFTTATLTLPADDIKLGKSDYTFYFGPNSYPLFRKIAKTIAPDFNKNIYLGWPPVNLVNKWVIIPIFNWLKNYIHNFGIIIIILVLIIKLALSPLSYKSYISMAKMKVLQPELKELKEKYGDDMQQFQQEQMKLYQQVGVNPLSGCIPMLLQMPILFAMFYFFPSSIELRQQPFLWADDLSTYDSIMTLPFKIPMYGDHVSLFVLLMTASTILYTWSNNKVSTVEGPMKSVGYMMPLIFMFILNSFPAALSFYYFVSNIITFGQQALIRKFVDEEKIKAVLEENRLRNKHKKKSKFQLRLEQAMKAKEEAQKKKKR